MEIGKSNNHLLLSVLLWTLYWMMQCFAFQSFKNCAGICRGSWEGEGKNETEDGPKVWGPDSSARDSAWTCQKGSEVTQQDSTAATQRSAWLLHSSLQRALLWARTQWKITARRSSQTKKTTWLETMLQAEGLSFSKSSMLQPPSTGSSWPIWVSASCKPEPLAPEVLWAVPQATCWCLLPQLS